MGAGRLLFNLDTNLYFGAAGLNSFPASLFFVPYYGAAVIAFFGHVASIHHKKMQRAILGVSPQLQATVILIAGVSITALIFYGLTNGFTGLKIPEQYQVHNYAFRNDGKADSVTRKDSLIYRSDKLILQKISDQVYVHISHLSTEAFGLVSCNGMVVINKQEAVIFDTPANAESTVELIRFLTADRGLKIKAIVATHFHADCVAGLDEFHRMQVPSYANKRTIKALRDTKSEFAMPQNSFDTSLKLQLGDKAVYAKFIGEGHTRDNVVGYFPDAEVLFGGCLIKEMGAGKGNLEDANLSAWAKTVGKIRNDFPNLKTVIPGHGKIGGPELLDYTIKLFQ